MPAAPRDKADTPRHGRHVHGRIAAADDQHALGAVFQAAFVERLKELDAADAVGRFLRARHVQRRTGLCAETDEHRAEFLLKLLHGDVHTNLHAPAHLDAQIEHTPDLAVQHVARHTIAGNAVAHHAAQFGARLEDGAGVAHTAQLIGAGEAGDAAAHQGDPLARRRAGRMQRQPVFERVVADMMLHRIDADEALDLVAVTAVLAQRRTDAAHDGGKRIGLGDALEGVFLPRHAHRRLLDAARDVQPAANILAGRAAPLTGRRPVYIGRALIGFIGDENPLAQLHILVVAILVTAKRKPHIVHSFLPAGYRYSCILIKICVRRYN